MLTEVEQLADLCLEPEAFCGHFELLRQGNDERVTMETM
jgi:hypothetical protein